MSEYLSKKAVLEWLNEQANNYTGYGHEGTEAIRYIKWRIETSTDFDADTSEIQRLRAALEKARTYIINGYDLGYIDDRDGCTKPLLRQIDEALSGAREGESE